MSRLGLEGAFLRTVVARRVVLLFFVCALVPTATSGLIGYRQVTKQLVEQSRSRLRQASRIAGMSVARRLEVAWTQLGFVAAAFEAGMTTDWWQRNAEDERPFTFTSVFVSGDDRVATLLHGESEARPLPRLDPAQREHLRAGKPLLVVDSSVGAVARLLLVLETDGVRPDTSRLVWGELNPVFLWGNQSPNEIESGVATCALSVKAQILSCPPGEASAIRTMLAGGVSPETPFFEWTEGGSSRIASVWELFLRYQYGSESLVFVTSESGDITFAPLAAFRPAFLRVSLVALVVVLLLSNVQIRRNLQPLDALRAGTARIASGDYSTPVHVRPGDEFTLLASSFNAMATRIHRQFGELETRASLDHSILASLDRRTIVRSVLEKIPLLVHSDRAVMIVLDGPDANVGRAWLSGQSDENLCVNVSPGDLHMLMQSGATVTGPGSPHLRFMDPAWTDGVSEWIVCPSAAGGSTFAILAVGSIELISDSDVERVSRLADQIAIALANVQLIDQLNELSWGSMTAFARAIDAKSRWTAGHSERVTRFAVRIGREMNLPDDVVERLRRGAILHDIGKIGVPAEVLDKPARLTDEEMALMRQHPVIGARILEPIRQYADILPVVLYHHERFSGGGYPEGISGTDIPDLARILSVADVFDALTSDRPYRRGMPLEQALSVMRSERGRQFDPVPLDALLSLLERNPELAHDTDTLEAA
jgi:putative nucleotidyltransferase with HDIG domain